MENMRKIVFLCQMGMVGTDAWHFVKVPYTYTEKEIEDLGQSLANDNAEMYGFSSYPNEELEEGEEDEEYDDNIGAIWCDYDPKKHDGYSMSGTPDWTEY